MLFVFRFFRTIDDVSVIIPTTFKTQHDMKLAVQFLRVSKEVYNQCHGMLYSDNRFEII